MQSIDNAYLNAFKPHTWTQLLGIFAAAGRATKLSGLAYCQLATRTVSNYVDHVAAYFVEAGFPNP